MQVIARRRGGVRGYRLNKWAGGSALPRKDELAEKYDELLRENVRLKEACEKAQNAGTIYTHIALSLARGYTDLYYVNMDTDEFIEFHTDDENGVFASSPGPE